tara:strand:+ start:2549 stop:2947 length:399 start_codon:yes stop_codon:yes gene_type:complete
MAIQYDGSGITSTLTAEADLSAKQYFILKQGAADLGCDLSNATTQPLGVLTNKPTSGQAASVVHCGVTQVSAGAAITRGALLKVDANGQVVTAAIGSGNTFCTIGKALQSASGANSVITALINCLDSGNQEA